MSNEIEKKLDSHKVIDQKNRIFSLRKIGLVFFILLIVGLIGGEGFFYYYFIKSQAQITDVIGQLQTAQQETAQQQATIIPVEKNLNAALESIQQLQTDVKQLQQEFTQTQVNNKNKLKLMQAAYYVKLANDNVQYINDIPMALNLLKMADQMLQDLSDATYDDARKALANDITALQSAPKVDVTGLYMRLTTLNTQLDQLQLPNKLFVADKSTDITTNPSDQPWWRRGLETTWQALQKIVVIRYNDNNTRPFITPEQQLFLYQNLHAMLEQTIWGLLHGQTAIYQVSLQQTAEWTKEYFVTDSSVAQAVLNELNQLQQIDIHPANPSIINSVQAFKKIDENNQ